MVDGGTSNGHGKGEEKLGDDQELSLTDKLTRWTMTRLGSRQTPKLMSLSLPG